MVAKSLRSCLALALLALAVVCSYGQSESGPPAVGEGTLVFKSPVSGQFETVPLTHTDVNIDVRGPVAAATVTQQYSNTSPTPIEAVYVFPLPHDAAVYDMEIRIGDRVIRSEIRERAEAKKVYEAARAEGKRAALLEQERPNIFTASVANIMPGDRIDVRLRYVQPLAWEDGHMRLTFPMVVGPRYIPGSAAVGHSGTGWSYDTNSVPDASRITPVVRHPENRSGHDISVAVDLDAGVDTGSIKSISHVVNVRRLEDGRQRVELATGATIPYRDFVLEVQEAPTTHPTAAVFLSPNGSGDTHFVVTAYPPTVAPTTRMPVEMFYMIDVSGSMAGTSIEQARAALLQALDRLRTSDRFAILAFSTGYREFSPAVLDATSENVAAARKFVQGLQANGGTEMLPALQVLMRKPVTPGYLRHIVLLTDGDLGNEEEIFASLHGELGNARLYTVAIGSAPNLYLATKMAQYGRGTFTHIADNRETQEKMGRMLETIESPVLADVKLSFEGVEVADVFPTRPPDLFLRQPLLIFGRITRGSAGRVRLSGRAGNQPYETTVAIDTSKATFHPGITTLWARQRVEEYMDEWSRGDDKVKANVRALVIAHAIRYHLVTRFTSLVAVEQVATNASGQMKTTGVPTEMPAGWQMEQVFGPKTGTADDFLRAVGIACLIAGIALWVVERRTRMKVRA